ncbi:hypothetical protein V6N11_058568 [Hibiscus sabdariffa]|uniref:Uncharacterized protein n=1 Tax=Hibiscus sabdariffa TaxID=183260 RepID=A0ABR2U5E4_9ROSI
MPIESMATASHEFLMSADISAETSADHQAAAWYADYVNYIVSEQCHASAYGGHFGGNRRAAKVLQSVYSGHTCIGMFTISANNVINVREHGIFPKETKCPCRISSKSNFIDVWGIDFIVPFPSSFGNLYILLAVDYVSK